MPLQVGVLPNVRNATPGKVIMKKQKISREVITSATTHLRWGENDDMGVTSSGWNPFNDVNVCYTDQSATEAKISIIIEPPAPGTALSIAAVLCVPYWPLLCEAVSYRAEAHGYFFSKNPITGRIDMIHRSKPFRGKEHRKLYKDCTYFGVVLERRKDPDGRMREESMFTLTSGYSDKNFPTGINFSSTACQELGTIIKAVNDLIYSVQDAVDDLPSARVYPLFCTGDEYEIQCMEYEKSLLKTDSIENHSIESVDRDSEDYIVYLDEGDMWLPNCNNESKAMIAVNASYVKFPPIVVQARV